MRGKLLSGIVRLRNREMRMVRLILHGATKTEKVSQKTRRRLLSGTVKLRNKEMHMVRMVLDGVTKKG